jgi:uncharacterized membrane protein YkvA (DUF1232 family)
MFNILTHFNEFVSLVKLSWRLLNDDRVPMTTKLIPALIVLYLLSPIDIIPDFILGLGQIDDVFIVMMGLRWFTQMAPADVVLEHRTALDAGR